MIRFCDTGRSITWASQCAGVSWDTDLRGVEWKDKVVLCYSVQSVKCHKVSKHMD